MNKDIVIIGMILLLTVSAVVTPTSFTLSNENPLIFDNIYYCKVVPYQKGGG